ncbi:hypothetical protein CCHOA_00870 [Corynebacterium choanae]|uniref:Uncharacterized protein n=1 Tax=Corynebacterium choanae TaxID=1862358 RepID=A0A3G6J4F5_9CORY|nr:hypothetical protein CCHOA_00870 [Corynebacterium choanae]
MAHAAVSGCSLWHVICLVTATRLALMATVAVGFGGAIGQFGIAAAQVVFVVVPAESFAAVFLGLHVGMVAVKTAPRTSAAHQPLAAVTAAQLGGDGGIGAATEGKESTRAAATMTRSTPGL